ncbi:MAG: hypothetical protein LQ343_002147 [Gyalolechia ehrenbergii]|nr:MAG: hypothetical protein LQ343_002147 [Gyalolechia ehrenbergii]
MNAMNSDLKSQLLDQIRQEAAVNNARALITKLNAHCFEKCVPSPGASLSKREEGCLSACMEKYMATWNVVSRTYIAQVQKTAGRANLIMGLNEVGI